jgi:sulfite exporter TauE/SafE/copper chaperone CopZ
MAERVSTTRILVDGMTCGSCEQRIEKAVAALEGVRRVGARASLSEVMVYYEPDRVGLDAIHEAIRGAGYTVREQSAVTARTAVTGASETASRHSAGGAPLYRFLGLIAVIAAVYLIIRYSVGFTFLPSVSQSMGYGLIFVVGLLTSLHCIVMCGGIVLSQGIQKGDNEPQQASGSRRTEFTAGLLPSLLYNGGRVVSYTVIGGAVGALGSLFSLSTTLKGVMPIVAGAFMLFLGVRMLGIFPWLSRLKIRFPGLGGEKVRAAASRRGPFVIGLLNGLMPCGPLQTMQVYALGTGSFFAGALSMFLFSLGTVPLLLGFGAISALLSAKFNRRMLKASGVLVMVLGLIMFTRGMSLFGVALPSLPAGRQSAVAVARLAAGYQEVRTTVESGQYHPFVVQKGVPVRWVVSAKPDDLNGCNNPLTVPQYGIRKELVPGDNLIEFTPLQEGTITYTCWMGMISSSIRVVSDLTKVTASDLTVAPSGGAAARPGGGAVAPPRDGIASAFGDAGGGGGCCGSSTSGRFAGGTIPVDVIQVAQRTDEGQVADVTVNDDGYTPAVIVVQKGVKAKIRFIPEKLSACNSVVYFPEYQGGLALEEGKLETPYLDVAGDFTFECGMSMLHGYVKVVDDITRVDMKAVARQVAAFKPAASGGGCCGK